MTLEDIKQLPIRKIASDNCVLFLWVTMPLLEVSFEVIKSWGFTYKTVAFTWVKKTVNGKWGFGNGYWTRANPELCLLATRGKPKKISSSVRRLVIDVSRRHSEKPDCIRSHIVELLGDLPRIELFGRKKVPGWIVLGNEVTGNDIRDDINKLLVNSGE